MSEVHEECASAGALQKDAKKHERKDKGSEGGRYDAEQCFLRRVGELENALDRHARMRQAARQVAPVVELQDEDHRDQGDDRAQRAPAGLENDQNGDATHDQVGLVWRGDAEHRTEDSRVRKEGGKTRCTRRSPYNKKK